MVKQPTFQNFEYSIEQKEILQPKSIKLEMILLFKLVVQTAKLNYHGSH